MIAEDRDALLCDLAETYGIFNYRALPVDLLATLSVGLREDSRIKMRLIGTKATRCELMFAAAIDRLSLLVWAQTKDGRDGVNRPKSVFDSLMGIQQESGAIMAFDSAVSFEDEWQKITGVRHGN